MVSPTRPAGTMPRDGSNEIDLSRFGVVSMMKHGSCLSERVKAAEWAANFAGRNEDPEVSRALLAEIQVFASTISDPHFKATAEHWLQRGQAWAGERHPELIAREDRSAIRSVACTL